MKEGFFSFMSLKMPNYPRDPPGDLKIHKKIMEKIVSSSIKPNYRELHFDIHVIERGGEFYPRAFDIGVNKDYLRRVLGLNPDDLK